MKHQHKNISRRLAAAMMAGAMMVSMVGMTAFATGSSSDPGQFDESSTFTIEKHLQLPENTYTPSKTFTFNVAPASVASQPLTEAEIGNGIEYGVSEGVTDSRTASFTANATADNGMVTTKSANFTVNLDAYGHAGVYKYVVTETADSNDDNFNYDNNTLVLYVHIRNDSDAESGLAVDFIELIDPDGGEAGEATKIDGFTNKYGVDNEDTDKLYDITLKKVIDGELANLDEMFEFTVKIDSEYDNDKVMIVDTNDNNIYGDDGDQEIVLEDGVDSDPISLGNGDTAKIFGLTDGDAYTIVEKLANQNGYTTTVTGDILENDNKTVKGSISADTEITFTNTKNAVTPTGIAMTIAPYAIMVVAAAGVAFLFLRRRNSEF